MAGSLRAGSFNRSALRAAQELAPEGVSVEAFDLADLPLYNQDQEQPAPEPVQRMKDRIRAADAILFVTPEYNYSISGVLKNAIDWGSRPYGQSAWSGKACAIMGASPGMFGTARAQYHLRQVLLSLNLHPLNQPEVMIASAAEKFDASGKLTNEKTKRKIGEQLRALVAWAKRLGPEPAA